MGTDVQVSANDFKKLLELYREFTNLGMNYLLFGHFGDAHLHFNFMPDKNSVSQVKAELDSFYKKVSKLDASPFAEHGVGLIKQQFMTSFYGPNQYAVFKDLKETFDSTNKFFPLGFLSMRPTP